MNLLANKHLSVSPTRSQVYTPSILKSTYLRTNIEPSYNSTQLSRKSSSRGLPNIKQSESLSDILNNHILKERTKAQSAILKKHKISLETSQKQTELEAKLKTRALHSLTLSTQYVNSKKLSATQSQRYIKPNIDRKLKNLALEMKEVQSNEYKKFREKPQKIADTLNKPGVNTWMNLASGGRMRSASADLPAPTGPSQLNNWEIFSGYLGPLIKPKNEYKDFPERKQDLGFCHKVQPIYRNFTYDQALYYLQLRKQGMQKDQALRLSCKIHCDLNEKEIKFPQVYSNEDRDYDKLIKRFEKYAKEHLIKGGEIVKGDRVDAEILQVSENCVEINEDCLGEGRAEDCEKNEGKKDPRLVKMQKYFRRAKKTKSLVPHGDLRESEENEDTQKAEKSERNEIKFKHSLTEVEIKAELPENSEVKFAICRILPKKDLIFAESSISRKDELEEIHESSNISEHESESEIFERFEEKAKVENSEKNNELESESDKVKVESFGFRAIKIEEFKENKQKVRISEKIKKKIEKKLEINLQNSENMQKTLENKLKKLKKIAEDKKKIREEGLKVSKKRKVKFFEKVRVMKERKETDADLEAEIIRRRVQEKLKKAEENKKKLEIEREKKLEEQRIFYDSKRVFFEYLQSLSLVENKESAAVS